MDGVHLYADGYVPVLRNLRPYLEEKSKKSRNRPRQILPRPVFYKEYKNDKGFVMLRQIAIMALLVLVGICFSRGGFLSEQGSKDLGAILVRVIIPVVIVKSFSTQRMQQLGLSFLLALLLDLLAMAVS